MNGRVRTDSWPISLLSAVQPVQTVRPAQLVQAPLWGRPPGRDETRDPDDLDRAQTLSMLDDLRRTLTGLFGTADERVIDTPRRRAGRIRVPVRFHAITDGRRGRVSRAAARRQIATLNAAYGGRTGGADTGVSFRLVSFEVTRNRAWFRQPQRHERAMKGRLRRGGRGTLNLFSAAVGSDVLGFSTFPQWYRRAPGKDGVVVDHRSLRGGAFEHYDRGYTAVHEIGHWLGLFHTFENGCQAPGDAVADTPYEAVPTEGCPGSRDTCPQSGADPVHNFMNYGWDDCMREFTPGQGRRIRAAWAAFRAPGARERAAAGGGVAARSVGGAR
ncbi:MULTISPECIES: zinc metalloprotease [Actinomadura]|uniref:Zinc metalloprotease n=1 Tax=Actinomadura yumaensis TaxID=111807 RepID=A0ABW2CZS0_9ACTN|nr:zinc metalloprotease [Actinomadura sp. J1-007]MWK36405.1 zinc metalloprotease [Actinomadura sp. J1-007]